VLSRASCYKLIIKGKFAPVRTAQWRRVGSGGIAPPLLPSSVGGISGQIHAPAAVPSAERAPITIRRRLGDSHSWSGRCGVEKN
jgi:hypothetical protein